MNPTPPSTPTTNDLVYTVAEIADRLKISLWMVNKLIRERKLRSIQIGARRLVPAKDLEEYLRELRKANLGVRHGW
ncbi:helix-turn-helix domain-containing protein [Leifsonia sp. RAF41]|uniref:helix-turn-helix domain-containing protein n=1 Tax=Leifsonia sp. RAF41 TaxID=3233056 RepID=UPI003F9E30B6